MVKCLDMKLYQEDKDLILQAQHNDPFFQYLTKKLMSHMKKSHKLRVIDLGCGSGRNVIAAAKMGFDCLGIDISNKAIEIGREKAKEENLGDKAEFINADILKMKSKEVGLFDFCIMSEVIEHMNNHQEGINIAYSLLKKGGVLLLTTPHDPKQWNILDEYAEHVRRFTVKEIKQSLKSFSKVRIFTVGFPFHRLIISLYHLMRKLQNKKHQPGSFRDRGLFSSLYFLIGSLILRFDNNFNFTRKGTTIVATAEK